MSTEVLIVPEPGVRAPQGAPAAFQRSEVVPRRLLP